MSAQAVNSNLLTVDAVDHPVAFPLQRAKENLIERIVVEVVFGSQAIDSWIGAEPIKTLLESQFPIPKSQLLGANAPECNGKFSDSRL